MVKQRGGTYLFLQDHNFIFKYATHYISMYYELCQLIFRDPSTGKVKGSSFNQTVLGALLTKSCLPTNDLAGPWEFFETPSKYPASVHARTESQIWSSLEGSNQRTHEIFTDLFKVSTKVRHLALGWIAEVRLL